MISAADFRADFDGFGEVLTISRVMPADAPVQAQVRAVIKGFKASDVAGAVQQGERRAIVSASDLENAGFPLPLIVNRDRIIWAGKTLVVKSVDDATRRFAGVLVAYELTLAGA